MTDTVAVDSSVVPKWFVPEVHSEQALRLRSGYHLVAPTFLQIELANIYFQKVRRGELEEGQGRDFLQRALPLEFEASEPHLATALDLALRLHPSVYDCLYAAVALARGCPLVTADRPFYQALASEYPEMMIWVEDIPEVSPEEGSGT